MTLTMKLLLRNLLWMGLLMADVSQSIRNITRRTAGLLLAGLELCKASPAGRVRNFRNFGGEHRRDVHPMVFQPTFPGWRFANFLLDFV